MATGWSTERSQGTARVQQRLAFATEHSSFNISTTLSHYNTSFAGVVIDNDLLVSQRQLLPEDALR